MRLQILLELLIDGIVILSRDKRAWLELPALLLLLLLQQFISNGCSHVPATTEFRALENIARLLLLLLLLLDGTLLLTAHSLLVVVLLPELFGEAVVGGGITAGSGGNCC